MPNSKVLVCAYPNWEVETTEVVGCFHSVNLDPKSMGKNTHTKSTHVDRLLVVMIDFLLKYVVSI